MAKSILPAVAKIIFDGRASAWQMLKTNVRPVAVKDLSVNIVLFVACSLRFLRKIIQQIKPGEI